MTEATQDQMIQSIYERFQAMDEIKIPTEEEIRALIAEQFNLVVEDEEFVRKMRFGGDDPTPKMVGSKYARFGLTIEDVEWLYDLQRSIEGQKRAGGKTGNYSGPSEMLSNTFRTISEAYYLSADEVKEMDQRAIADLFPQIPLEWYDEDDRAKAERGAFELTKAFKRAMDSAESGYGSQLIGAQYVGDLWEGARRESRIMGMLPSFEMTAPTAYLPVEADIPEMLFVSENTANDSSNYDTTKTGSNRVQLDAKTFVIHQMWSGAMEEDSLIPYVPFLRRQTQISMAHYGDSLVLNGDTTNAATGNINLDDADPADTKHYLAFDGIRHAGIVDNTDNQVDQLNAAIDLGALREAKGLMVDETYLMDWGHPNDPNDLVFAADPETADQIAALDDVLNWFEIQGRPLLTGQVVSALGHPVVGTMALGKTEADGKISTTAGNNTRGQCQVFNRRGLNIGWRRRAKLETERLPGRDQTRMVTSLRLGLGRFSPTGAASGIKSIASIFNINLS